MWRQSTHDRSVAQEETQFGKHSLELPLKYVCGTFFLPKLTFFTEIIWKRGIFRRKFSTAMPNQLTVVSRYVQNLLTVTGFESTGGPVNSQLTS